MRRSILSALGAAAAIGLIAGAASPASAAPPPRWSVQITAHTDIDGGGASEFESTIPGCESGEVLDIAGGPHFTPLGGSYRGLKEFTCDGGETGFVVQLTARFGDGGATGSWTLQSAWGDLDGFKGSGSLVGIPTAIGIDDIYVGQLR